MSRGARGASPRAACVRCSTAVDEKAAAACFPTLGNVDVQAQMNGIFIQKHLKNKDCQASFHRFPNKGVDAKGGTACVLALTKESCIVILGSFRC